MTARRRKSDDDEDRRERRRRQRPRDECPDREQRIHRVHRRAERCLGAIRSQDWHCGRVWVLLEDGEDTHLYKITIQPNRSLDLLLVYSPVDLGQHYFELPIVMTRAFFNS